MQTRASIAFSAACLLLIGTAHCGSDESSGPVSTGGFGAAAGSGKGGAIASGGSSGLGQGGAAGQSGSGGAGAAGQSGAGGNAGQSGSDAGQSGAAGSSGSTPWPSDCLFPGPDEIPAPRPLGGAFLHMGYSAGDDALPMASLTTLLDELKSLGASVIVLNQTRSKKASSNCLGSSSDFEWIGAFPDRLGEILDAAQSRNMQVWVGTTMSTTACPQPWLPPNNDLVRNDVASAMAQLYADWGSHPAFAGWYIPDEPGHLPSWLHGYYYNLRWELKQFSPEKPVMVAPYLAGSPPAPDAIAAAAVSFRDATGVDVQAWQDSVGATSTKLPSWSRTGYSVQEYFTALRGAIGSQLWADVELFNFGKPLFNTNGVTGGYRSAAAARIAEQLESTSSAEHVVSWLPQYHASSLGTAAGYGEGPRLFDSLRAMASSKRVPICKYSWAGSPDSQYPDGGEELFDGRTADPTAPGDPGWTGTLGEATVQIDLGGARTVQRIAAHVLTIPAWGIWAPSGMVVECSGDGVSFQNLVAVTSPIAGGDYSSVEQEEYVIDSGGPVNASCSHLRLTLQNEPGKWTFVSEVELQ